MKQCMCAIYKPGEAMAEWGFDEAAPGSQVFVYYRALAKPIAKRLFSPHGGGNPSDGAQFISAVCWKPQAQTLLAANSQGCIKVMHLTS